MWLKELNDNTVLNDGTGNDLVLELFYLPQVRFTHFGCCWMYYVFVLM